MRRIISLLLLLQVAGCGLKQVDLVSHSNSDGVWRGPSYGKYYSDECYAVGFDYPAGYDWRADSQNGTVKCSLVMFADGVPVLKIPVGDAYEVSSEGSRHRVMSGRLYTDYTDGRTTVIKKDGEELIRYDGAEEIVSMVMDGNDVHSLSVPRDSSGFVYRVNGVAVVERTGGVLESGLSIHDGKIAFCFSQKSMSASGYSVRYYKVIDGKVTYVELDDDIETVLDVCISDGEFCLMALTGDSTLPVMICDGMRRTIPYIMIADMVSCRFVESEQLCVRFRYSSLYSGNISEHLWFGDSSWKKFDDGYLLSAVTVCDDICHAVANPSGGRTGVIYSGDDEYEMPDDYYMYGENCLAFRGDGLYVGLSSRSGNRPVIWTYDGPDTLDINGPLTFLQ